jgi:hypothetical protein
VRRRRFGDVAARPGAVMAFPRPAALSRLRTDAAEVRRRALKEQARGFGRSRAILS